MPKRLPFGGGVAPAVDARVRPIRYVFVATESLLHACFNDFAFVRPDIPVTIIVPGDGQIPFRAAGANDLVSTIVDCHFDDVSRRTSQCLGCLLRSTFTRSQGNVVRVVDNTDDDFTRRKNAEEKKEGHSDVFVFPYPRRVIAHVTSFVARASPGRCENCDNHFKATGNWSEAGVRWDRSKHVALQSPVIVAFQRHPTCTEAYNEDRDGMFQCYLPPHGRSTSTLWKSDPPHIEAPFSAVGDVITAVGLICNTTLLRSMAHSVLPRLAARVISGMQRSIAGQMLDEYAMDSPAWTADERALVEFIVAYWPNGTAWANNASGTMSMHDITAPLRAPLGPLMPPEVKISRAMDAIMHRVAPRHGDAYVLRVAREECARMFIADAFGVLRLLRDRYFKPSLSLMRAPRVEMVVPGEIVPNPVATQIAAGAGNARAVALARRYRHARVLVPTTTMAESSAWWFCGASPNLPEAMFTVSRDGKVRTAVFCLKTALFESELDRPFDAYPNVPAEAQEDSGVTRGPDTLRVAVVAAGTLGMKFPDVDGVERLRDAVWQSHGFPRVRVRNAGGVGVPPWCVCQTDEAFKDVLRVELPSLAGQMPEFARDVLWPVQAMQRMYLEQGNIDTLRAEWLICIANADLDAGLDALRQKAWDVALCDTVELPVVVARLAAEAVIRRKTGSWIISQRVYFDGAAGSLDVGALGELVDFTISQCTDAGLADSFFDHTLEAALSVARQIVDTTLHTTPVTFDDVWMGYANREGVDFVFGAIGPIGTPPMSFVVRAKDILSSAAFAEKLFSRAKAVAQGFEAARAKQVFLLLAVATAHKQAGFFKDFTLTNGGGSESWIGTVRKLCRREKIIVGAGAGDTAREVCKGLRIAPFTPEA